jgi:hypothetical protein
MWVMVSLCTYVEGHRSRLEHKLRAINISFWSDKAQPYAYKHWAWRGFVTLRAQ